jgi:hypothetical protein
VDAFEQQDLDFSFVERSFSHYPAGRGPAPQQVSHERVKLLRWDNMSANNGDKSRYGRQRKEKINRRLKMRALRKELVEAKKAK